MLYHANSADQTINTETLKGVTNIVISPGIATLVTLTGRVLTVCCSGISLQYKTLKGRRGSRSVRAGEFSTFSPRNNEFHCSYALHSLCDAKTEWKRWKRRAVREGMAGQHQLTYCLCLGSGRQLVVPRTVVDLEERKSAGPWG